MDSQKTGQNTPLRILVYHKLQVSRAYTCVNLRLRTCDWLGRTLQMRWQTLHPEDLVVGQDLRLRIVQGCHQRLPVRVDRIIG